MLPESGLQPKIPLQAIKSTSGAMTRHGLSCAVPACQPWSRHVVWWQSKASAGLWYAGQLSHNTLLQSPVDKPKACTHCFAGFFDVASTRLLQYNVPDAPQICVYYRVGKTYSATSPQQFRGAMTLLKHREFRFYEQEPSGVPMEIGIFRPAQGLHPGVEGARQSSEPMAVGRYTVRGDEHGKPIAVKLFDSSGNIAAEVVFLVSCAPGQAMHFFACCSPGTVMHYKLAFMKGMYQNYTD